MIFFNDKGEVIQKKNSQNSGKKKGIACKGAKPKLS